MISVCDHTFKSRSLYRHELNGCDVTGYTQMEEIRKTCTKCKYFCYEYVSHPCSITPRGKWYQEIGQYYLQRAYFIMQMGQEVAWKQFGITWHGMKDNDN